MAGFGIGQTVRRTEDFRFLTGGLLDYCLPRADDLPEVVSELVEIPAKPNPLGVTGIGGSGTIGAPPTVVNAILDALAPLRVDEIRMPATPSVSGRRFGPPAPRPISR